VVLVVTAELTSARPADELVEHVGWYTPYYYLSMGMNDLSRSWNRDRYNYYGTNAEYAHEHRFNLPGAHRYRSYGYREGATAWEFSLAVGGFGGLYLLAAGLLLWRTALGFDRLVGRAGRDAYVGDFDSDGAIAPAAGTAGGAPAATEVVANYAGFWRRAVAAVVDGMILQGGSAAVGLAAGFMAALIQSEDSDMTGRYAHRPEEVILQYVALSVALSFAIGWLYYAAFESSSRRATPGKSLVGIYVSDAEGRRVSFLRASLRYFAKTLSAATFLVGYVMAGVTRRKQALHDRVARTLVLKR
jgi:uncharacterized RDD family membrane protein YckC